MKAHQDGSYQDRIGRAAEAKQKALDALKARPAPDEAALAARREAARVRAATQAEKKAARLAEREEAVAHKARRADEAAVRAEENEGGRIATDEERKAMRDARYAARKNRK
jgi:hypothetical protein